MTTLPTPQGEELHVFSADLRLGRQERLLQQAVMDQIIRSLLFAADFYFRSGFLNSGRETLADAWMQWTENRALLEKDSDLGRRIRAAMVEKGLRS